MTLNGSRNLHRLPMRADAQIKGQEKAEASSLALRRREFRGSAPAYWRSEEHHDCFSRLGGTERSDAAGAV